MVETMTPEAYLFAGFGGQGVLLMGTLLAQAGMDAGKQVTYFPAYGPAMRGGTANCSVMVSAGPIASPVITRPDVLVVLNEESWERFGPQVRTRGIVVYNQSLVTPASKRRDNSFFPVRATALAEAAGNVKAANMVMLGALAKVTGVVTLAALQTSLPKVLPAGKHELLALNHSALEKGYTLF
jgi:2-oxoglutarate ferredoxin oxidoreductase subunit gamma